MATVLVPPPKLDYTPQMLPEPEVSFEKHPEHRHYLNHQYGILSWLLTKLA